jgi:sulfate adenylyltransferase
VRPPDYGSHRTLIAPAPHADELRGALSHCVSWTVAGAQLTDLETLLAGFLSPCAGYGVGAVESEFAAHVPCPALEISRPVAGSLLAGTTLALRDPEGVLLAGVRVSNVTETNGAWMVSGRVEGIELPTHHDFRHLRLTATEIEERLSAGGWRRALAFFPTRLMHAGTRAALMHLAAELNAAILVLVAASEAEHDELAFYHRVRGLEMSSAELPGDRTVLALIPINLPADPAERVLLQRIVARNCGATYCALDESSFAEGASLPGGSWNPASAGFSQRASDPASAGLPANGSPGAALVALRPWGFNPARGVLEALEGATGSLETAPSESAIVARLATRDVPPWLFSPAELERLHEAFVPRTRQGFTVFFTGLSGSGKSTIAGALRVRLMELTGRPVTLLDGDLVRRHLSSELGFSREHRDLNILRIGWVAAEITRHGGIVVCAPIAPYDAIRKQVRAMVEAAGGFVLVHVATSLETCERRDRKGLYARARAGQLPQFTGISDPYETPDDAALRIDTEQVSVDGACGQVVGWLRSAGYLAESETT